MRATDRWQMNADDEGYVLFVWSPTGWTLREEHGELPPIGTQLEGNGHHLVVSKHGPSPLPGDHRPCAFTVGKD